MKFRRLTVLAGVVLALGAAGPAWSDERGNFPDKPLRLLVGYAPGSGADVVARLVANTLQDNIKQTVIVENKPGAGGAIATQEVARATPDGYTLLMAAMPQLAILPAISKVPYDTKRDFEPVAEMVGTDLLLVANPEKVPANSLKSFVEWAKTQPSLFFGTPGAGTVGHFGSFLFAETFGVPVEAIHYRTTGDQLTGLVNGDTQAQFFSYGAALPLIQSGRVKPMITTSPERSPMFPDTPTARELGYPKLEFASWYGVLAPAGTPTAILDKLSAEIVKASQNPETVKKLADSGLRATGKPRKQFAEVINEDIARWAGVVQASGFKMPQ